MLETGSLVDGKYRVLKQCGQGGMSVVYMAINERANKTWAIKEVRKDGVQDFDVVRQGLIVETELLMRLNHPNLPSIVDVIDGDGSFLIVMDYIEGRTLEDLLAEYGAQPQEDVIDWAKQLCNVLAYLHSRRPVIIYRDMKPSNVMLKPDGSIVLFDFGTAREYKISRMEDTTCLGTRGYAAPEQYGGHGQTDPRTDIYCLGATMYHLLTGHNPGEPPYKMYPIRRWNPTLSAGLETIILKCTQANPADRYQSCIELLYDLEHFREADHAFRRSQISLFHKFAVPAMLAVVCGIGALTFRFLEESELMTTYEYYISGVEMASGDTKISYYRSAICLEPTNEEAWLALMEEFLNDDIFTVSESEILQSILLTNENSFEDNASGYDTFCYKAGIAYYYKLETGNGKSQAKHYFEVAKDSGYLPEQQIARAERLYKISEYYSKIGIPDNTGDAVISYLQYWDDLTVLSAGNLVEADNASTALIMYRELAGQIVSQASEFKDAGVTEEQMLEQLENMEEHIETDFDTEGLTVQQRESMAILESAISQARTMIDSVYGTAGE